MCNFTTLRALLLAAVSTVATGLHLKDGPSPLHDPVVLSADSANLSSRMGVAAELDPEGWGTKITRANPNPFHVANPGEYPMIVMPGDFNLSRPHAEAELVWYANFQKSTVKPGPHECEDNMIRGVWFEGTRLGADFAKLGFSIAEDAYPATNQSFASLQVELVWQGRGAAGPSSQYFKDTVPRGRFDRKLSELSHIVKYCEITPSPYVDLLNTDGQLVNKSVLRDIYEGWPNTTMRRRIVLYKVECTIGKAVYDLPECAHSKLLIEVVSMIYRLPFESFTLPRATLQNELRVSLTNVGKDGCTAKETRKCPALSCSEPGGILGSMSADGAKLEIQACQKKQPVNGPWQYVEQASGSRTRRPRKGPKHPFGRNHY